jgi:hypothetical protein
MIHNLKDSGVAYTLSTYDNLDGDGDGSLWASIEAQRDWTLQVEVVAMPIVIAVQLAAVLLRDFLADHSLCESCDWQAAVNDALDGLAAGGEIVCGDPDYLYLSPGDQEHLAKLRELMETFAAQREQQLPLFVDDPVTGELVVNPEAVAEA